MKRVLTGVLSALLSVGCATQYSEAPLATNFPTERQPKLQAAAHWLTIADDVAGQLSAALPGKPALYIRAQERESAFQHAFLGQLTTSLIAAGHPVFKTPEGALAVEIETQSVAFAPNRPQYRHGGTATALGAGLWVLHDVATKSSPAGVAIMAALAAGDSLKWFQAEFASGATPSTEIIVTATASDSQQLLARSTSVYYVADHDAALYATPARSRIFEVRGE